MTQALVAYGITLCSDIDVPVPYATTAPPRAGDVAVVPGSIGPHRPPDQQGRLLVEGDRVVYDGRALHGLGVAAVAGTKIIVDHDRRGGIDDPWPWILGRGLPSLLHQRAAVPLHANVVSRDGAALLIAGDRGAGKSTLTGALLGQGWSAVTDDLAVLDRTGDQVRAMPGLPVIKLTPDAARQVGIPVGDAPLGWGRDPKHHIDVALRHSSMAVDIVGCLVLSTDAEADLHVTPLNGRSAVMALLGHVSAPEVAHLVGDRSRQFDVVAALASSARVVDVRRPRNHSTVDAIMGVAEELAERGAATTSRSSDDEGG